MNAISAVLWTFVAIVLVLWLVGMVASYTFGGLIHLLLLVLLIAVVVEIVRSAGRRT
jgi:hypothetical protein